MTNPDVSWGCSKFRLTSKLAAMDTEHEAQFSTNHLKLTGTTSVLWEVMQNLSSKEEIVIHRTAQSSHRQSIESGWETIVISIISAGGVHTLGRVIVECLRQRRTTLDVQINGNTIHFEGSQNSLDRTRVQLEKMISNNSAIEVDPCKNLDNTTE